MSSVQYGPFSYNFKQTSKAQKCIVFVFIHSHCLIDVVFCVSVRQMFNCITELVLKARKESVAKQQQQQQSEVIKLSKSSKRKKKCC